MVKKRQPGFLAAGAVVQDDDEPTTSEVAVNPSRGRPMETTRTNQCTAHRKNGDRCRKASIKAASVCRSHGGAAPQVQRAARVRLAMAADDLVKMLLKIALSSDDEDTRLRATMSALDRTGVVSKAELDVSHELKPFEQILANLPVFTSIGRGPRAGFDAEPDEEMERYSAAESGDSNVIDVEAVEDEDPPERPGVPFHLARTRGGPSEMEPGPGAMPLMTHDEAYGGPAPRRRGTRMSR